MKKHSVVLHHFDCYRTDVYLASDVDAELSQMASAVECKGMECIGLNDVIEKQAAKIRELDTPSMGCIKYDENGAPVAICHELAMARSRISELDAKLKEYEEDNTGLSEAATKLCGRIDSLETVIEAQAQRMTVLSALLKRVIEWEPAYPVEASLADEIAEALAE